MSNWNHVSSKLGKIQPATRSIAKEIYDEARKNGHEIWFMWGMGSSGEHRTGRALDLMVRNKAAGDWINAYVWKHRARLRLRHVIWWQRITSTVTRPGVARLMVDRGNSTANHKDHPHVLFNPGAYRAPSAQSSKSTTKGIFMALSDKEQNELLNKVRRIDEAIRNGKKGSHHDGSITAIVKRIARKTGA